MKCLVVFYSRDGHTRELGKSIAKELGCEVDEILDSKSRRGLIRWFKAGFEAMRKRTTNIEYDKNPKDYDLVIIGSPVWGGTITPAIRSYLEKNKLRKVAFFCTYGGSEGKIFKEMERLSGKPVAKIGMRGSKVENNSENIRKFCSNLT